jgi:hypothetical protein
MLVSSLARHLIWLAAASQILRALTDSVAVGQTGYCTEIPDATRNQLKNTALTPELAEQLREASGAARVHILHSGEISTMERSTNRLTIRVNAQQQIISIQCN